MDKRDTIYSLPLETVGKFEFDETVVGVFADMINRSVPGYQSILAMIGELSTRFASPGTNVYDLGCSLGAATLLMDAAIPPACTLVAIDSSAAMIKQLTKIVAEEKNVNAQRIQVTEKQIQDLSIRNASFSVLNFTLQFIPQHERDALLQKIAQGTLDGGALVLSEKITFADPHQQQLMVELHHDFKRAHGYSDLEIAQKRTALEETLTPETLETHQERLLNAGFSTAVCWFQCLNFVSILAVK